MGTWKPRQLVGHCDLRWAWLPKCGTSWLGCSLLLVDDAGNVLAGPGVQHGTSQHPPSLRVLPTDQARDITAPTSCSPGRWDLFLPGAPLSPSQIPSLIVTRASVEQPQSYVITAWPQAEGGTRGRWAAPALRHVHRHHQLGQEGMNIPASQFYLFFKWSYH